MSVVPESADIDSVPTRNITSVVTRSMPLQLKSPGFAWVASTPPLVVPGFIDNRLSV